MSIDFRVDAALEVVRGTPAAEAARARAVEPELVERWVEQFVTAGAAAVTNTPSEREAASRDRFLDAISHELRTPLTVVRGWMAVLDRPDLAAERRAQASENINTHLDRLEAMIELMEDTAAASLGRLKLDVVALPLESVLADLPIRPERAPREPGEVRADPRRLVQALTDIVTTLERQPDTEDVRLFVTTEPAWTRFETVRRGSSMSHEVVHALFEPFSPRDGQADVTFGLYRARALVIAFGGQIGMDAVDGQETFWVRVPRAHPDQGSSPNTDDRHLTIVKDER